MNKHLIVAEAKKLPGVNSWHEFGGQHTDLKLWVVEEYLKAYAKALKRHFSKLWYIDAFAGTGRRTVRHEPRVGDLLDVAIPERIEQRRGSAQIAIDVTPQFDRIVFMESKPSHCAALRELAQRRSDRDILIVEADANQAIQSAIGQGNWDRTRAVMFLDPYGMDVEWATLKAVAATRAIDVWYLFPLSGFYRQATRRSRDIDPSKRGNDHTLNSAPRLGAELYSEGSLKQADFFRQGHSENRGHGGHKRFGGYVKNIGFRPTLVRCSTRLALPSSRNLNVTRCSSASQIPSRSGDCA